MLPSNADGRRESEEDYDGLLSGVSNKDPESLHHLNPKTKSHGLDSENNDNDNKNNNDDNDNDDGDDVQDAHTAHTDHVDIGKTMERQAMDEIVERIGFGAYQRRLFLLCGLGWLADSMWMEGTVCLCVCLSVCLCPFLVCLYKRSLSLIHHSQNHLQRSR